MPSAAERRPFWALVAVTLVLDRITKVIAEQELGTRTIEVVGEVLRWRLVYNPGAAFGLGRTLGPASRWVFMVVAVVAVWLLWRMSRETPVTDRLRQWA
ncbi:MAG: signal peptidase II, partial [Gemmatimonadetes bacterium]|nr:signal peptidase II [Gemmatimonadota bacterium]